MATRIINALAKILTDISSLWLFGIMILVGSDVFMRYTFNAPIPGTLEISEQTVVLITFLCFAYAGMQKRHVQTTAIVGHLPSSLKFVADVVSILLMLVLLSLLVWRTSLEGLRALRIQEIRMGLIGVPIYPSKIAIPIGLSVAWLYYFLTLLSFFKRRENERK